MAALSPFSTVQIPPSGQGVYQAVPTSGGNNVFDLTTSLPPPNPAGLVAIEFFFPTGASLSANLVNGLVTALPAVMLPLSLTQTGPNWVIPIGQGSLHVAVSNVVGTPYFRWI